MIRGNWFRVLKSLKKSSRAATRFGLVAIAALAVPQIAAAADNWPSKPVTIVVPYGPGAVNDLYARTLAGILSKKFNQPFVVDNRAGAGSYVGTRFVSNAAPDGYTLLENSMTIAGLGQTSPDIVFNAEKDVSALGMMARSPYAMLVATSTGANTVKEFVDYAKSHPDTFFGTSGYGSLLHMLHEQFNIVAGTKIKPVVYQGGAPMIVDMSAGRIHYIFGSVNSAVGPIQAGQIKVLAYTGPGATADSPKAPILKDLGYNFESMAWFGIFGPPGMAPELKKTINAAINEAMQTPEAVDVLSRAGASPNPISVEAFDAVVRKEIKDLDDLKASTNIKPQ